MFEFIYKMLIRSYSNCTLVSFRGSLPPNYKKDIKFLSLPNGPCLARPSLVSINSNKTSFVHLLLLLISVVKVVTLLIINMLQFVLQIK